MFEDLIPEFQEFAEALYNACGLAGLLPQVTSTRRSPTAQARLYRRWKAGLSSLPAAPPGLSAHEYGYAFDMIVTPRDSLADVGYTWQTWGGVWGGEADPVHFQYPGFVVPPDRNVVQRAADAYNALPWWATVFAPLAATNRPVETAPGVKAGVSYICKTTGYFC